MSNIYYFKLTSFNPFIFCFRYVYEWIGTNWMVFSNLWKGRGRLQCGYIHKEESKLELMVSFCAQRRVFCIYIMPKLQESSGWASYTMGWDPFWRSILILLTRFQKFRFQGETDISECVRKYSNVLKSVQFIWKCSSVYIHCGSSMTSWEIYTFL